MLVSLKELLEDAKERKYAVGAFNTPNLETLRAVLLAAEEQDIPVIIAHAEVHENWTPLEVIGPVMVKLAQEAKVPVCVHLDHGASFEACVKAMRLGFTSVMYDGSAKGFEDNVKESTEIVKIAHALGVSVEAELGHIFTSAVGGGEGRGPVGEENFDNLDDAYTNPDMAKEFVERTDVDALAIAFGTTHGVYLKEPRLDLNRITQIKEKIDIPFVMHGGSGLSVQEYQEAIQNGITKINYYTYSSLAGGEAVQKYIKEKEALNEAVFFHDIALVAQNAIKENVKNVMSVFLNK